MTSFVEVAPHTAMVYLVYKCPSCESDHYLKREETEFPGAVLCPCGQRIRVRQIEKIHVKPLYREFNFKKISNETVDSGQIAKDAISALANLGWKKYQTKEIIACLISKNNYNDVSELLRDFFKLEKERKNHGK